MADDKKKFIKDINDLYNERNQKLYLNKELLQEELNSSQAVFNWRQKTVLQDEYIKNETELINKQLEEANRLKKEGYEISEDVINSLEAQKRIYKNLNTEQAKQKKYVSDLRKSHKATNNILKQTWKYLMESDKAIKSTILNLGLSGAKAEEMRTSFEGSAGYVARLGGNLSDIQTIMTTYANETGRARTLSAEMVKDVTKIGKGTGLGIEQAAKLAGQFEFMGLNARDTMEYVQGVVETSELMGVNTTKVMNEITDNFKRLQTFTFTNGVRSFGKMAQYAEKFRISVSSALDIAEKARNLENVVDMAAQLQVMGGEFAKTDPYKILYQARNAPEEFQKSIAEMTKGLVTFRKTSEGTFEKFISPADQDRLRSVAKTLGISNEEITEMALRAETMTRMRQQMIGMGLTKSEKELIEGMGEFSKKTGKFTVMIGGVSKDIRDLTKNELKILKNTKSSLDDRAKAAQTFDEAYKATIEEFKTILLPMLRGVNKVLGWIRPIAIKFNESISNFAENKGTFLKIGGGILAGAAALKIAAGLWGGISDRLMNVGSRLSGGRGKALSGSQMLGRGKAAGARAAGRGTGMMKGGIGIGAAGLGIGAGVGLAAEGISSLADAMSKLDKDQVNALQNIVKSLSTAVIIGTSLVALIGVLSPVLGAAAIPMLAFGGAALMVGGAIGIAATGVGNMAEGLGTLINSAKGAGPELFIIAKGISAIGGSLGTMAVGGFGLPAFAATLGLISRKADDLDKVGTAFSNINTVLRGSREDFENIKNTINAISNADLSNLKQFSQLNKLLSGPIKVEFSDKEVALVSNVTLNMDGYKMTQRIAERVPVVQKEMMGGKESGRY